MGPEKIERIFEPYYTSKELGQGTGLGLAVVHGIVKKLHGLIRVESTLGAGSVFFIFLPALEESPDDLLPVAEAEESEPDLTGTERILVVDDEELLVRINKRRLESLGYAVTAETDSRVALEKIQSRPDSFDLLITGQTMAGLTGLELMAEARKVKPQLPVILCSGHGTSELEEEALSLGIDQFISKPIIKDELLRECGRYWMRERNQVRDGGIIKERTMQ